MTKFFVGTLFGIWIGYCGARALFKVDWRLEVHPKNQTVKVESPQEPIAKVAPATKAKMAKAPTNSKLDIVDTEVPELNTEIAVQEPETDKLDKFERAMIR